jgi:hypothetical protein
MRIDQTLSELRCLRKSGHRVHRSKSRSAHSMLFGIVDPPAAFMLRCIRGRQKLCCLFVRCFLDRRRHFCSDYQNNNLRSSAQPPSVSLADGE